MMDQRKKQRKAQAAIELAVFGAILIFVIGVIIKQALQTSYWQNQNLKAMRLAMKTSYESVEQSSGSQDVASRRTATVLFVEDRLTADSAKYGSVDRSPQTVQASATHNRNIFMPVDFGDCEDLPVIDVIVNGKHFVFTVAGFRTISFSLGPSSGNKTTITAAKTDACGGAASTSVSIEWDPSCAIRTETSQCTSIDCLSFCPDYATGCSTPCVSGNCPSFCADFANSCTVDPGQQSPATTSSNVGCADFFTIIDNHPLIAEWCGDTCPAGNLTSDERFDLDRDGTPDVPSTTERPYFLWQWYLVRGYDGNSSSTFDITLNGGGEITVGSDTKNENTALDVDGDLALESVMSGTITYDANGMIASIGVMDSNDGDVDFSISKESGTKPQPGFTKDVTMYTFVRDRARGVSGTYFKVEEGKLFSAAGNQFIRTARKKDQVDLIERVFRLSNDTGRYCSGGLPTVWGSTTATQGEGNMGFINPVEACGSCFTSANISKTCMDTTNLLIFVRSRIQDLRGRKWVTDTSGDPYVDFMSPAGY